MYNFYGSMMTTSVSSIIHYTAGVVWSLLSAGFTMAYHDVAKFFFAKSS